MTALFIACVSILQPHAPVKVTAVLVRFIYISQFTVET